MHKITVSLLALTFVFMSGSPALCDEDEPVISFFAHMGEGVFGSALSHDAMADSIVAMGVNQIVFAGVPYPEEPFNSIIRALKDKGVEVLGELAQFNNATLFPESVPTLANGELLTIDTFTGCANYHAPVPIPEYYDYALDQFKLAVDTHPELDGLVFDFIRWPLNWHTLDWELGERSPHDFDSSFDPLTIARFEEGSGIDIPNNLSTASEWSAWIYENAHDEWGQWKSSVINRFCEEAYIYLKATGEHKILGAATVPWTATQYDEAMLKIVGQDYAAMAEWVEIFFPMTYHQMMGYPVSWIGEFATYCKKVTGRRTVPFVMSISIMKDICSHGIELSPEELRESIITAVNAPGSDGVIVFFYGLAISFERMDEILDTIASLPVRTLTGPPPFHGGLTGSTRRVGGTRERAAKMVPLTYSLFPNSPNPFNPNTQIRYELPQAGQVRVDVYDIRGVHIRTLVDQYHEAGHYQTRWAGIDGDGRPVASGVYLYRLKVDDFTASRAMSLAR